MVAFPGSGRTWWKNSNPPSPEPTDLTTSRHHSAPPGGPARLLHGRRKGRPLRPGQQALVENLLPTLEIKLPADAIAPAAFLDGAGLFDFAPARIWLEVGFGAGEHLAAQARAHADTGMIGCEPFLNGTARLLTEIDADGLTNIRIFRDDARLLLAALPDAAIAAAFVLFPDPWPKARHHKRRFISPANLADLARVLGDGAELRVATDDAGYQAWILQHVLADGSFEWLARTPADWRNRTADWPETRYEAKARAAGRPCAFFRFLRRPRTAGT